jgi:hypothetical protein
MHKVLYLLKFLKVIVRLVGVLSHFIYLEDARNHKPKIFSTLLEEYSLHVNVRFFTWNNVAGTWHLYGETTFTFYSNGYWTISANKI